MAHGFIASVYERKCSPCQQDDTSPCGEGIRLGPYLPEDIWRHIHALMPLRDAARAACASHTFLRSWRCRPNLTFRGETLGLNGRRHVIKREEMARDLIRKVDHILKNHSGVGMKKLELYLYTCRKINSCYLDRWLHTAVTAGIEELVMSLSYDSEEAYDFPCSLLFNGSQNSIRYLRLSYCAFRPTTELGCCRSLTTLFLSHVWIADQELEWLLSNSTALEKLRLLSCTEIVCLKIPCLLQRLSFLSVAACRKLQVIESNAPNISTFHFTGNLVRISLGGALQVKDAEMYCMHESNMIRYARTKLLSWAPNVETLSIASNNEIISTPMLPGKFVHLKYLRFTLYEDEAISPACDYLSLVPFLEASPWLETFIFQVIRRSMKHESIIGDSSHLRQLPEHRHDKLKSVSIGGFSSAKSLVELTCHIVENASALECLLLDTTRGSFSPDGCSVDKPGQCARMGRKFLVEACRARLAIRTHIEGIIPSRVKLDVVEPCRRCHDVEHRDSIGV
ncbi:hypothetical protein BRADI_5g22540v3 [Brachypodium distachyon]|uniref:At1g61320/AtMIF1 LRR domain-containing protein n=1 Tax=Brachypodium distachyon TaxID=15368 RepID=A0A2K2CIQ6_BRADI|nr:hypothetical protein BRADI_5g22540v3 [Brachypodium distachyon]